MNKSIFGVHDPFGLRYLFQLRASLSPLRSHKSRHNFIDTPSDICHCKQGVEDTSYFLFFWSPYVTKLNVDFKYVLIVFVTITLLKIYVFAEDRPGEPIK